jgi:HAD superfamily phosphoserine phosphatase-like hydrolase
MERHIKGIIFDVDGTLIQESSWQKLNLALGVSEEMDQRLFKEYYEGKFTYQEWIDKIVAVYHLHGPVHRHKIERILTNYTLAKDAENVCRTLQARPYHVGIVSGGIDVVVSRVASDIGIHLDFACANSTILYDQSGNLDKIVARGHDHEVKLNDFYRLCELWGISPAECVCVGDDIPDKQLFEASGNGITFDYPRCSMLHGVCWKQITQLADLLTFL